MEKKYIEPTIEIIYLLKRDVITTSDGGGLNDYGNGNYGLPEIPLP